MKSKDRVLNSAHKYIRRGWSVIPIPRKEKAPRHKEWQKLRIKESEISQYFDEDDNIGILLGKPSHGLVDVDLDCDEAVSIAPGFLSKTDSVYGRKTRPGSHHQYRCKGAKPIKFNDPEPPNPKDACLLELRSTGQQSVAPPSIHPSGERVRWEKEGRPARVSPDDLVATLERLAAATLLAKRWKLGIRNEVMLPLSGALLRAGWKKEEIIEFVEAVALAAIDEEPKKRRAAVEETWKKLEAGKETTGIPKLVKLLGEKTVGCLCEWLKIGREKSVASVDQLLEAADSLPEIHPSQSFHDGALWYGVRLGKNAVWINSRGEFFTKGEMQNRFFLPSEPTMSRWSLRSVRKYRAGKTEVQSGALFLKLRDFLSRRIRFVASWQPTVITLWIIGSYLYRVFDWYGYLWLTSPGRRTGKTKLLEIISAFAYNATPVMTDPTEAILFRETGINASTQVLDEVESLRAADKEKRAALMSVINVGFKAGSSVPRFNMDRKRNEYFDAFCPRVLAGISGLASTVADRCIKVFLKRKLTEEKVARFSERKLRGYLQHKRDQLYKFGLKYAPSVAKQYEAMDSFSIPPTIDDRARDILEPLFAIASVLDTHNPELKLIEQLVYAAEQIAKDRASDEGEDEETAATLKVLIGNFPKANDHWPLTTTTAQGLFHESDELEWVENRRQAGRLLHQLGLRSKTQHVGKKYFRGYRIDKKKLEDLCKRYGVATPKRAATT